MKSAPEATIMYGGNASFVEALYEDYLSDPQSVAPEWRAYFEGLGGPRPVAETAHSGVQRAFAELARLPRGLRSAPTGEAPVNRGFSALINAYRAQGHLAARFEPLGLRPQPPVPELDHTYWGLTDADLNETVTDGRYSGTLRQVLEDLRSTYCGSIGFEYAYLPREEREWLQARIEANLGRGRYTAEQKKRFYNKVAAAEGLEKYLHQKYVGQKRFSLEGSETFIPYLDYTITRAGEQGVKEVVIGMAHRGRLNVLINIFGKKTSDLFDEFEGKKVFGPEVAGDVKYHLGFSSDVETPGGSVHLALAFNPSHLEIVGPVVEGSVRARQDRRGDTSRDTVLPIVVHGDAAVAGQGVVAETLNLSQLRGYATGGTVHVVINNQVGFTTSDPRDARSSRYSTDVAKMIDAPVFHVNSDDVEATMFAAELALDYRMTFKKDVFVDVVSFRRHGHNESDEPRFTQPMMYRKVDAHPGTRALYAKQLEAEGVLAPGEQESIASDYRDRLDRGEAVGDAVASDHRASYAVKWSTYLGQHWTAPYESHVPLERLKALGARLTDIPAEFKLHRGVERVIKSRREMIEGTQPIDWGFAENLAYATLLTSGFRVRISGQDSGRGTFSHRQAVLHNQATEDLPEGELYIPLNHIADDQAEFEVIDSALSEEAVLAFEYGYTSAEPGALVIWEAQYGDFANGAQAVIDQFISAGETKWQKLSGLTMLLPHGYEGQGPEHSSARLERYMQLCAEQNIQVVVPSTPAQMYHMLRRQALRPYRKPLVVMSPKSMLRNKASFSTLEELAQGTFQPVIGDVQADPARVNRVVLCSGKLYWELVEAREKAGLDNVAIVRIEQLYPFAYEEVKAELIKYPGAQVIWTQEEPANQGAWLLIREDIEGCLQQGQVLSYSSRPRSASPAVGYAAKHLEQQKALIDKALGL
ncbi:2-oxoglutarate dehydrogenase E1 component [Deinobacterium chartae]|uniref:oxoglutarate dehydrogenase (succinyl-transferring) n=1 Tax=Deinobacterium chartae TaxID=521158 RepID=A0A841HZW3_9DEIO|nr:2-oxoglutarate dehydrogenase E1 component [Deinobacterium chartae]MBB6097739.1 2-oxoglutarate dehydrogenase E1 component [Deinobacterium chartae]